jgi:imidazolonepropionase-like amidohydrolase
MILRLNLVVLWLALSAGQGATGFPSKIAITHVTVIDVRAGTIKKDMTVLIVGDRISAVRAAKEKARLPTKEIEVIDGQGKYLIPGLWDMHVHTDGDDRVLRLFTAYGITGIRDMAGDAAKLADARRRITSGELTGPRLVFSGPMLEGPPSQADDWTWIIHSPEEARNAIDRLVELRVDFIKVHDGLARESYFAIAAASKEKGISFVGHVPASMTPAEASDLGQKSIEHLEFVPKSCHALFESVVGGAPRKLPSGCEPQSLKELLHRFDQNGTWLDPTIQSFRYWAPTQWSSIVSGFRELVPSIRQNHISILAGTDSSSVLETKDDPPGASLHDELALLVEAGFTPSEALRAATLNPALFLGLSDSFGTIEAGKTASVVLLEANPLQDIRNTQRIVAVISEGRYFNRDVLERLRRENCRNCSACSVH